MAMLHIVNKSPFDRNTLATCLRLSTAGSTVLLFEDAVVGAVSGTNFESEIKDALGADKKVCVLGPDLNARGFDDGKVIDGVSVVDYAGFVALTADNDSVSSWL